MICTLVLGSALMILLEPPSAQPASPKPDLSAYEAAKSKAGRDADAQVKLALWCEAHGLTAERIKHLTLATLINPSHTAARGLLGLISYQGKWQHPDQVSHDASTDPARKALVEEYMRRRVKTLNRADDQWKLALWCEQNGLNEQAAAHLNRVVQLDPRRDAAWRRLGYKKTGSRWARPELLTAEKAELECRCGPTSSGSPGWSTCGKQSAAAIEPSVPSPSRRSARSPTHGPCPWSGGSWRGATRLINESRCRSLARSTPRAPRVLSA